MAVNADMAPVLSVTTASVDAHERFDHFCDALCDVYLGIRPQRTSPLPFDADVLAYAWDGGVLSRIRATGHDARRDNRAIAQKPDDALFLNLSNAPSTARTGRDPVYVPPASPLLLDNSSPFHLSFDPARRFELYSLRIPRTFADQRLDADAIADANRRMATTPAGAQLALQARLMTTQFAAGQPEVAGSMLGAVTALLGVLFRRPAADDQRCRLAAYKSTAQARVCDTALAIGDVAAVHETSVRTVQKGFAESGETFSAWLLAERLDLVRLRLSDPTFAQRSIARIVLSSGFSDYSYFHRAFRARFGDSPGSFRPR